VVTLRNPTAWSDERLYASEHTERVDREISVLGSAWTGYRIRTSFGPVVVDATIAFDTPAAVAVVPYEVGARWQGAWRGPTSGTLNGRTFGHTTIRIGSEDVEVWASELTLRLSGATAGTIVVRSWISPRYRMPVREQYDLRLSTGPGYRGRWTSTLRSTRPRR
jgi:hypothetical protein